MWGCAYGLMCARVNVRGCLYVQLCMCVMSVCVSIALGGEGARACVCVCVCVWKQGIHSVDKPTIERKPSLCHRKTIYLTLLFYSSIWKSGEKLHGTFFGESRWKNHTICFMTYTARKLKCTCNNQETTASPWGITPRGSTGTITSQRRNEVCNADENECINLGEKLSFLSQFVSFCTPSSTTSRTNVHADLFNCKRPLRTLLTFRVITAGLVNRSFGFEPPLQFSRFQTLLVILTVFQVTLPFTICKTAGWFTLLPIGMQ